MRTNLLMQRDRAMDRADVALDKAWPERKGQEYTNEMTAVARELERVAQELDKSGGAEIERSRTYRFLAGVFSDLEPALGEEMLTRALTAFQKAEALLEGLEDPLDGEVELQLRQHAASDR